MNPFSAFLEDAEAAEGVPDHLFGQCLDSPYGDKFEILQFSVDLKSLNTLISATESILRTNSISLEDQQPNMRKVAAVCLALVKNSTHPTTRLTALKELLLLGSVPGSKGNGVSTPNVLEHVTGVLAHVASLEIKDRAAARDPFAEDDAMDDDEGEAASARPALDATVLLSTCKQVVKHSSLFLGGGSADLLDGFVDCVAALLFLGSVKTEFAALKAVATDALDASARYSAASLISIMRCLLPALSLRCDDNKIPESPKARTLCHRSAVKVVERLVCDIHTLNEQFEVQAGVEPTAPAEPTSEPAAASPAGESRSPEAPRAPPRAALPTGFAAVVGVLQRVLLSCPDKAPIRAQVAASICAVVKAMVSPLAHKRHAADEAASAAAAHENVLMTRAAVDRFLSFTANIVKSSKVARRSFAVEVAALLVRLPNIWHIADSSGLADPAQGAAERRSRAPHQLLLALFGRCRDIAATVRTRALAAVASILDDLGEAFGERRTPVADGADRDLHHHNGFPVELCQGLYRLIVEDSFSEASSSAQNFMDTLRLLAGDEKPTTRVKALRAYGTALSLKWPKLDASYADQPLAELEAVSMLVADDDINMLSKGCSDSSVSVRKQAVDSLTDLLLSRPVDSYLQDAWVTGVLPLMVDPEATVQQKVAQSVFSLVIDTSVAWVQCDRGSSEEGMAQSLRSLGWVLCSKLVQAGLYKMFKNTIPELLRSGLLSVETSGAASADSISVKELVAAMEYACTLNLDQSAASEAARSGRDDRDIVSHSAWVILEAMIDNENAQSSSGGVKCYSDLDALYKSDFVVRCWEARMGGSGGVLGCCADDVRILRVLQSTASRNKDLCCSPRFKAINKHLLKSICEMNCNSSAVAAALAVLFAPMASFRNSDSAKKSSAAGVTTLTSMGLSDPAFSDWFEGMLLTLGQVLEIAFSILYEAVVGHRADAPREGLFGGAAAALPRGSAPRRSSWSNECFGESDVSVSYVNAALFAVGEIAMLGFSADEEDAFSTVASAGAERKPQYAISRLSHGAYKIIVPEQLVKLMQLLLADTLPAAAALSANFSQQEEGSAAGGGSKATIPTSVRANAFISVGKLCVRDKARAGKCVNIFLRELQVAGGGDSPARSASVRSNALLILGDLCVRFTNLVDRHIGTLASCLQDEDVTVRKNAFVLLVQLLVQDFLKWRGMLLYRFLAIIVDPDEDMAEFAKLALKKALDGKFSGIFKQHFIEAVVILNDCRDHPAFIANETSGGNDGGGECLVDLRGVDMAGARNRSRRMSVYEFIMEGMTEEDKIQATAKMVQDILSHAVDNGDSIRAQRVSLGAAGSSLTPMEEVVADAFRVLRSPMLKVGGGRRAAGADEDGDALEGEAAESQQQAMHNAKIKVLKKLSVQHMIEHVLPVVSSLKHCLERCRSPLQRPLMEYLCEIARSHKSEVEQVLAQDPCLKAEIEYDMRMFEKTKEAEAQRSRLQAAEMAADSALSESSARKSLGGGSASRGDRSGRRRSFGGLSGARSPLLKKTALKLPSADDREEFNLAAALNDSNHTEGSPAPQRWSISISSFSTDENHSVPESEPVSRIPQGVARSPLKEKSGNAVAKPRAMDRSDGSSPAKKKARAGGGAGPDGEPLPESRRSGRRGVSTGDSLLGITK